jgi:hypothetical protein
MLAHGVGTDRTFYRQLGRGWDERRCARSRHGPNALSATSQGWDLTSYGAPDLVKLHLNHPIILSQSGKYSVVIGDGIQNGWRFCQNCAITDVVRRAAATMAAQAEAIQLLTVIKFREPRAAGRGVRSAKVSSIQGIPIRDVFRQAAATMAARADYMGRLWRQPL